MISLLISLVVCNTTFAQNTDKSVKYKVFKQDSDERAEIDFSKKVQLAFSTNAWNVDSTKIDQGKLAVFDRKTESVNTFDLVESEANSGLFKFDVNEANSANVAAEFYTVPQDLKNDSADKLKEYIKKGILKRKPFIMRKSKNGLQEVDIFNSKAEMDLALEVFRKQYNLLDITDAELSRLVLSNATKVENKAIYSSAIINSSITDGSVNQSSENKKNNETQDVLLKIEKDLKNKKISEQKGISQSEIDRKKLESDKFAKLALDAYTDGDYQKAQELFEKSSSLDPLNEKYYYFYGISLYRNDNFNKSLAVLTNATAPKDKLDEREFYLAMNQFKLKDYEKAILYFQKTIELSKNNIKLLNTSYFYRGICELEDSKYNESIQDFQFVLDHSDDADMDKKAEDYIEYAVRRQELERRYSKKLFLNALMGTMYDSNMLFATDSARDQGTANDIEGYRLLTQGQVKYRPFYDEKNEFAGTFDITNLHSVNNKFERTDNVKAVDPTIMSAALPWTHKTKLENLPYSFDLSPTLETTFLDPDATGSRSILDSYMVNFNNSIVSSSRWITNANMQVRYDNSNLSITSDADNQDSLKLVFNLSASYRLSEFSQRYIIPEIGYISNNASGSNYNYSRADVAISYVDEIFWKTIWSSRLGYYAANYKNSRNDNNYSLQTSFTKLIAAQWNFTLFANFTQNNSTTNQYHRFTMMTAFSYSY